VTALAPFVVHVADPPVGGVQHCGLCGFVLLDFTPWLDGTRQTPAGREPNWWPAGRRVATNGPGEPPLGITYAADGPKLAVDERWCA
jgi:hypothetical protein